MPLTSLDDTLRAHGWASAIAPLRIVLVVALAVVLRLVLRRAITRLVRGTGRVSERRRQRAETLGSVLRSIASFAVFAVAGTTILGELGVNLAPIVASAGVLGVAVGFGAQNLIKDFLAGMAMILEDQYGVGDVVDAGAATGTVEAVGLRTTRLRDAEGTVWFIRNGEIARVGNKSQGWSLAVADVSLPASSDFAEVRAAAARAADAVWADPDLRPLLLESPRFAGVESATADVLVVRLTAQTAPTRQAVVARALREHLLAALRVPS